MSATVIPGLMPRSRTSWPGSSAASRSFSLCQIGLMISATGRSGFGKASAGVPDGAMKSWAAPRMVSAAVKASAIAIRSAPSTANMDIRLPMSIAICAIPNGIMSAAM